LGESVAAFRQALQVYTREHLPQDWAMTQNNLGAALSLLGDRTGGAEGAKLLAEAVAAYRQALLVRTHEHLPQQWAMTQNNLGNALSSQGDRTGGAEGAKLLAESAAAYRQALQVYTRDHLPQQWATTQNNLGTALSSQGERTGKAEGAKLLGEAVAAFRLALLVRTREHLPQDWASTQNNVGNALETLGRRCRGKEREGYLSEAVAAYSQALTVFSRKADDRHWRITSRNLYRVQTDLALEQGDWEEAAEVAKKRVEAAPSRAAYARMLTVGLTIELFDACLKGADKLSADDDLKDEPDTAAEATVVRLVCQLTLGRKDKAAEQVKSLTATISKQASDYHPDGPWLGLQNYIRQTKDEHLAANRDWLLQLLDALLLEKRDDVVSALKKLPELK
jgi:tetratricopeptide (TPR) repeat protein